MANKNRSRLKTVVKFEIVRNLKKPSFWMAAILMPVLFVGYMLMASTMGMDMEHAVEAGMGLEDLSLGLYDASGLVDEGDFTRVESEEAGLEEVKDGELDVLYVVPENFVEMPQVNIYAKTDRTDLFANYENPIREAIMTSAAGRVAPEDILALTGSYGTKTVNLTANGEEDNIIGRMIIPMVALALFFLLICMFGNRLTMATVEEKENRISEMLLTSLSPTTLVIGKIISLIVLGLTQLLVLIVPMVLFYVYGSTKMELPFDLSIDWSLDIVLTSLVLLVLSYFLYTGLAVAVGSLVPTAKELAPYASVFMILVLMPIFMMSSFITPETTAFTYIMSYFPLSAPIALLMRYAFGVLPSWELAIGIGVLTISSALAVWLAVYIFRRSAMDLTSRVSLQTLLARGTRTKWPSA